MNATLADRRKEIVELGASVEEITKKYHFLTNEEDVRYISICHISFLAIFSTN